MLNWAKLVSDDISPANSWIARPRIDYIPLRGENHLAEKEDDQERRKKDKPES